MPTIARNRIRILGDAGDPFATPEDILRPEGDRAVEVPRNADTGFEFAPAFEGAIVDLANVTSFTLEIKRLRQQRYAPADDDEPLANVTVASGDLAAVTLENFIGGDPAEQTCSFNLTAGETANLPQGPVWLVIYALTTSVPAGRVLYTSAQVTAKNTGQGGTALPQDPEETYYTASQADARHKSRAPLAVAPLTNSSPGTQGDWYYDASTNRYFDCVATNKWIIHGKPVDTFDHS